MAIDPEYLRRHYASLSDQALLAINRAELVETAQKIYDDEVRRRELGSERGSRPAEVRRATPKQRESIDEKTKADRGEAVTRDEPDWLEEAAEVYTQADVPGIGPTVEVTDARDALEAAGIPCYLDLSETPADESVAPKPTRVWRLMVPGNLNLSATSVLDRDIFNAEFEAEWKTHLETLSDEELRAMNPQVAFCGLFDRVERVTRAYEEEIGRRGLKSESV